MGRIVLAIILGAVLGLVVLGLGSWVADYLFPPSPSIDIRPELAKTVHDGMPIMGFLVKFLAWAAGGFVAAYMAGRSAEQGPWPAWTSAGMVALVALVLALKPQNPAWFLVLALAFLGAAGFMASRLSAPAPNYAA